MRKVLMLIFFLALAASSLLAATGIPEAVKTAHKSTYTIRMSTYVSDSKCSGTAVGPHAILTATHCELGTTDLILDNIATNVIAIIRDDCDHTIFLVGATFPSWATFAKGLPQVGDDGYIFGNPDKYVDVLRKGYVSRVSKPDGIFNDINGPAEVAYDMNTYHGDSGSAIFNSDGEIVTVLTNIYIIKDSDAKDPDELTAKFSVGLEFKFTPEQIQIARTFDPKSERK